MNGASCIRCWRNLRRRHFSFMANCLAYCKQLPGSLRLPAPAPPISKHLLESSPILASGHKPTPNRLHHIPFQFWLSQETFFEEPLQKYWTRTLVCLPCRAIVFLSTCFFSSAQKVISSFVPNHSLNYKFESKELTRIKGKLLPSCQIRRIVGQTKACPWTKAISMYRTKKTASFPVPV